MDRSKSLIVELEGLIPIDDRTKMSLERILELLYGSYDDALDRNKSHHHVTGSSLVLSREGLLLHYHKKIHRWIQPGGHLDKGETPLEAAKRETIEETGVTADFEPKIFHVDVHEASGHVHYDIRYRAWSDEISLKPPVDESQSVAWFKLSALMSLPDLSNHGAFKKLLSQDFA